MTKPWVRGMLWGVSLAFVLTGGVALAQSLTVEPDCFQCWPGTGYEFQALEPGYPYDYTWESCGWPWGEELLYSETFANGYTMHESTTERPRADVYPVRNDGDGHARVRLRITGLRWVLC